MIDRKAYRRAKYNRRKNRNRNSVPVKTNSLYSAETEDLLNRFFPQTNEGYTNERSKEY